MTEKEFKELEIGDWVIESVDHYNNMLKLVISSLMFYRERICGRIIYKGETGILRVEAYDVSNKYVIGVANIHYSITEILRLRKNKNLKKIIHEGRRKGMTEKEFKELKVGDKVRIISTPVSETHAGVPSMDKWSGKIMTIRGMRIDGATLYAKMEEDNGDYWWFPKMIDEKVSDATIVMHLIKDGKTVIKLSDGRVGVAFCSPEDTFDEYEGVRLATARAYGKEPPAKKSKVKEVKRRAKVGEYIKIVNVNDCRYKNGDIFKVEERGTFIGVCASNKTCKRIYIRDSEYVVLEGYKPKK